VKKDFQTGQLRDRLVKYHSSKVDEVFDSWANTWLGDSFRSWNIASFLPEITCPCLILQGEEDEFGTLKQVKKIKSGIKGIVVEGIVENVGHNPHKESREYILKIVTNFIKSLNK